MGSFSELLSQLKKFEETLPSQIDKIHRLMVAKHPEIHAKGFGILDKFFHANGSFCQSPDSLRITMTIQ